jgi:hypothetical protein
MILLAQPTFFLLNSCVLNGPNLCMGMYDCNLWTLHLLFASKRVLENYVCVVSHV